MLCVSSLLIENGKMAVLRPREGRAWKTESLPVETIYGAVCESLGEEFHYQGFTIKKSPPARSFAVSFYRWLNEVMGREIFPTPIRPILGKFEKVFEDGFQLLGAGTMEERQIQHTGD